jgi:hypothetical protein
VQGVRERVVDDLDLRVVQQRGVGVDDPFDTVAGRERLGARPVTGCDRDEPVAGRLRGTDQRELGDPGGAEHADPQ